MKEENKNKLKEICLKMYIDQEMTFEEISDATGWSRTYITDLIKNDPRFINKKNNNKIKVYKRKDNKQMQISIPTQLIKKLGISTNIEEIEYVNISFNEDDKSIIIKKI